MDRQEFGIDIVGEDNKTIVHHKVAARVVCVLTEQEALLAVRVESRQNPPPISTISSQPGSSNGTSAFNFTGTQNLGGPARRPAVQQQGLVGIGGMHANIRDAGKSGITFDHILSRLQGELNLVRTIILLFYPFELIIFLAAVTPSISTNSPSCATPQQSLPTETDPNAGPAAPNLALSRKASRGLLLWNNIPTQTER